MSEQTQLFDLDSPSVPLQLTLLCDHEGCDANLVGGPSNDYKPVATQEEARELAAELGWTYDVTDLCPDHSNAQDVTNVTYTETPNPLD